MFETLFTKIVAVALAPFLFIGSLVTAPAQLAEMEQRLFDAEAQNQVLLSEFGRYEDQFGAALPQAVALFETSLAAPISASATTLTLTENSVRGGGSISGFNCFTIDEGSAQAEFVCGTVSGTSVTGLTRGVSPLDGETEDSDLQFAHRRGANVKITDFPLVQRLKAQNNGESTFENILSYASGITPTGNNHIVDVEYVASVVNGGTISFDQQIVTGTAGETMATGTLVYFDVIADEWLKADASVAASSTNVMLGISQGAGTDGSPITNGILVSGLDITQTGLTAGSTYYVSDTAGAFSASAGTVSSAIGIAKSTTELYFNPKYRDDFLSNTNTFSGSNTFTGEFEASATSTALIGDFPAWHIGKQQAILTTTGTSTFAVPSGVNKIIVEAIGPGNTGGSCSSASSKSAAGSGGGAGARAIEIVDVSATTTVQYYIGAAAGTRTTFGTIGYEFLTANGGTAGAEGAGVSGGTASGGDLNITGDFGATGEVESDNTSGGAVNGGKGGSTPYGHGGVGATNISNSGGTNGSAATGYGSGGGGGACGANSSASGGAGRQGIIIIRW